MKLQPLATPRKRRLKQWLLKRGYTEADFSKGGIFAGFGLAPRMGKPARKAIRKMQHRAKLPITGRFDKRTLDVLFPGRVRRRFRKRMASGMYSIRNVREVPPGSNWGPGVKKFLAHVGITTPAPWCAAAVWYVADVKAGYNGPKQTGSRAYVPHLETWAAGKNIIVPDHKGKRGMIVTWRYDGGKKIGTGNHVGVIMADLIAGKLVREGGGNEGNRVRISYHPYNQINTVIDLAKLQKGGK